MAAEAEEEAEGEAEAEAEVVAAVEQKEVEAERALPSRFAQGAATSNRNHVYHAKSLAWSGTSTLRAAERRQT